MSLSNDLRALAIHGALALAGLAVAWWATTDKQEVSTTAATREIVACRDVRAVVFTAGLREVRVDLSSRRIELTRAVGLAQKVTVTEKLVMAANPRLQRLQERWSPPMAKRALGVIAKSKREGLGLKASSEEIKLVCGERTRRFLVGAASYGGSGRYLEDESGAVWLVDPTLVSDVRLADSRYVERRLVSLKRVDLKSATIRAGGRSIGLTQLHANEPKRATWVAATARDQRDETYGNWLGKLTRLRALTWLAKDASPETVKPSDQRVEPLFEVVFNGDESTTVTVVRSKGPGETSYWATARSTGGWVTLSKAPARQLAADLSGIMASAASR